MGRIQGCHTIEVPTKALTLSSLQSKQAQKRKVVRLMCTQVPRICDGYYGEALETSADTASPLRYT